MLTFPGAIQQLWGSTAKTSYIQGSPVEAVKKTAAPGVDGRLILKMGKRETGHLLYGYMFTQTVTSMTTLWANIAAHIGTTGTLIDNYGESHFNLTLIACQRTGPLKRGPINYSQPFQAQFEESGG